MSVGWYAFISISYLTHRPTVFKFTFKLEGYMRKQDMYSGFQVGAWRDRIVICTGTYGPTPALIKAFLDSGAKAVISPSAEPPELQLTTFHGSGELNALENGKFEIGEEELEDEEVEPASPASDWEDSDPERSGDHSIRFWDDDEEELSQFIRQFYESLFREGLRLNVALQHALASHRKLRYSCHLPNTPKFVT